MKYTGIIYKYDFGEEMKGDDVASIQCQLNYYGLLSSYDITSKYDLKTSNAVKELQRKHGLEVNGIVDEKVWDKLFNSEQSIYEEKLFSSSRKLTRDVEYDDSLGNVNTFFTPENKDIFRRNNNDIIITYGPDHKQRILKNVIFNSKSQVISPSGEAIYDVYEFIARDIEEK